MRKLHKLASIIENGDFMKGVLVTIALCTLLAGCASELEKRQSAIDNVHSLQEKRDVLLEWSQVEVNQRSVGEPINAYQARNNYVDYNGEESDDFLNGLISTCLKSKSSMCTYNYYVKAANDRDEERNKKQRKISEEHSRQLRDERDIKTPVKKSTFPVKLQPEDFASLEVSASFCRGTTIILTAD